MTTFFYLYLALVGVGIGMMVTASFLTNRDNRAKKRRAEREALGLPEKDIK